jgi:predicted negative regulator of RcsB-dependent stress response
MKEFSMWFIIGVILGVAGILGWQYYKSKQV